MIHKRRRARRAAKPVTKAEGARRRNAAKAARLAARAEARKAYRAARATREAALVKALAAERAAAAAAEAKERRAYREQANRQLEALREIEAAALSLTATLPGGPAHAHPARFTKAPLPKALRHRPQRH